jgi:hypothetical protein
MYLGMGADLLTAESQSFTMYAPLVLGLIAVERLEF